MHLRDLAVALLLLVDGTAQATEATRGTALGLVTDASGATVAGAVVVLCSWPLPERIDLGTPDRVTVVTRADGRFTVGILDGRSYSAYAFWRDARGAQVTNLAPHVLPGVPCLLQASPPRACTGIAVRGGDDWRQLGPMRIQVVVGDTNPIVRELALDAALEADIPPDLPRGPAWVDVRARNGQLLRSVPLDLAHPGQAPIDIAAVFPMTLAVEDLAGKRLPDAEVHVVHDHGYFGMDGDRRLLAPEPIGRTGANGTLALRLPASHPIEGPGSLRVGLLVTAAGHQRRIVDVVTAKAGPRDRVTARLSIGTDVRMRLVDRDGLPLTSGVLPLYEASAQVGSLFDSSGVVSLPPMPMRPAADGSFLAIGLHENLWRSAEGALRMFALVDAEYVVSLGLPTNPGVGVPSLLPIPLIGPALAGVVDLGDVSVAGFTPVRFAVVDAHGAPVAGACVRLLAEFGFPSPSDYISDRIGRMTLPLPAGEWVVGAFRADGGVAVAKVTVPGGIGEHPVELRLSEPRVVRGIVAAGVEPLGADQRVFTRPGEGMFRDLAEVSRAVLDSVAIAADGSFEVQVPFGDALWELCVATGSGSERTFGPRVMVWVEDADVDGIVLPRPR